jgi:hypothetical protein
VAKPKARGASSERAKQRRVRGLVKSAAISIAVATLLLAAGFIDRDTAAGRWPICAAMPPSPRRHRSHAGAYRGT